MLQDLDKSLEELLKRELPPGLMSQVSISFAAPDSRFPPPRVSLPAIDLFLYDVRENNELRDNEWRIDRTSDGLSTARRAPVRVDCSYLVTAWPSDSAPSPAQDEHRLLGEVMYVLLRYPFLPAEILQGAMKEQEVPLPGIALQSGRMQSVSEFWQALGGKPKASLNLTITIGVTPTRPVDGGPVVTDYRFRSVAKRGA